MNEIIEYINLNVEWIRPIWALLGLIGLFIMKKYTRPSFYKGKPIYWLIILTIYYMLMGPLIFVISLLTTINPEK